MKKKKITLLELSKHLDLSPTTVSFVLNNRPQAVQIPAETRKRILAAAAELNYHPDFFARTLRAQRSFTIGVLIPELSDEFAAMILSGVEAKLFENNYYFFVAGHHHREEITTPYLHLFAERRVEGVIAIDTPQFELPDIPVVTVAGSDAARGSAHITINHLSAARLALQHLTDLGHRRIAFLKGPPTSGDTELRWQAIGNAARELKIEIVEELVSQLGSDKPSPETGFLAMREILRKETNFTALFTFNDVSAIGAIRALHESGRGVPRDVSVVGFDDIYFAAYQIPALTTIRQPLYEMGVSAAEILLENIQTGNNGQEESSDRRTVLVEPQLIVRSSTAAV